MNKKIIMIPIFVLLAGMIIAQQNNAQPVVSTETPSVQPAETTVVVPVELKWSYKPGFELYQRIETRAGGGKVGGKISTGSDIGLYEDDMFLRTEVKAKFDMQKGGLTLTPWVKERLESMINFNTLPLADKNDKGTVDARIRSRFFTGFDMTYKFSDAASLMINGDFRFTNDLKPGSTTMRNDYRYNEALGLKGKAAGFSYSIIEAVSIWFDSAPNFTAVELEGSYSAAYEFFQLNKDIPEKYRLSLACDELLYGLIFSPMTDFKYTLDNETFLGLKAKTVDFSPYLGCFIWTGIPGTKTSWIRGDVLDMDINTGFKAGLSYAKDVVSMDVNYIGGMNTENHDGIWKSQIQTVFKLSY